MAGSVHTCTLCGDDATFPSRNQLFAHLREAHELAKDAAAKAQEKIALAYAYIGDDFYGSCLDGSGVVCTVEGNLLQALNVADPKGLTRCARTDRGVHALHNVMALALPVLPKCQTSEAWVAQTNAQLPMSITLLRRVPVAPDFDARRLCDRRRYVYLIPYSALTTSSAESALCIRRRLKPVLKAFSGSHDFARFTRGGAEYVGKHDTWRTMFRIFCMRGDGDEPESDGVEQPMVVEPSEAEATDAAEAAEATDAAEAAAALGFVRISISGRSFLQLQIRKMIGAVCGVMRGKLAASYIAEALRQPRDDAPPVSPSVSGEATASGGATTRLGSAPTAPAFPLYLAGPSFTPYARRNDASMEDPADAAALSGEVAAAFERRLHAHIAQTEQRSGAFASWIARMDEEGWPVVTEPCQNEARPNL